MVRSELDVKGVISKDIVTSTGSGNENSLLALAPCSDLSNAFFDESLVLNSSIHTGKEGFWCEMHHYTFVREKNKRIGSPSGEIWLLRARVEISNIN